MLSPLLVILFPASLYLAALAAWRPSQDYFCQTGSFFKFYCLFVVWLFWSSRSISLKYWFITVPFTLLRAYIISLSFLTFLQSTGFFFFSVQLHHTPQSISTLIEPVLQQIPNYSIVHDSSILKLKIHVSTLTFSGLATKQTIYFSIFWLTLSNITKSQ